MLLSCLVFVIDYTKFDQTQQLNFIFSIDRTCMINLVIVLSGFHHRPQIVRWVLTVPIQFQHRPDLYDRSHHCLIKFLSQMTLDSIGLDNLVSFSMQTVVIQSITSLSCLIFITDHTWPDRPQQLSFDFGTNQTYVIGHVVVLSGFCHRLDLVQQVVAA